MQLLWPPNPNEVETLISTPRVAPRTRARARGSSRGIHLGTRPAAAQPHGIRVNREFAEVFGVYRVVA